MSFSVLQSIKNSSATVRKVDIFGNFRIYAYFQLPKDFVNQSIRWLKMLATSTIMSNPNNNINNQMPNIQEHLHFCRFNSELK